MPKIRIKTWEELCKIGKETPDHECIHPPLNEQEAEIFVDSMEKAMRKYNPSRVYSITDEKYNSLLFNKHISINFSPQQHRLPNLWNVSKWMVEDLEKNN